MHRRIAHSASGVCPRPHKHFTAARLLDKASTGLRIRVGEEVNSASKLYDERQILPKLPSYRWHSPIADFKRGFSTFSDATAPHLPITRPLSKPLSSPSDWEHLNIGESILKGFQEPSWLTLPNFSGQLKTLYGVVPEICYDELSYSVNYDPRRYLQVNAIFRKETIFGASVPAPGKDGEWIPIKLDTWVPTNKGIYLLKSLPGLPYFYHSHGVCLPRLTLDDLVITGAGTFRLRNGAIKFHEFTPSNIRNTYRNISSLLIEVVVAAHGEGIIPELVEDFHDLHKIMEEWDNRTVDEYRILTHNFFIPLGNKSQAIIRVVDYLSSLPGDEFNSIFDMDSSFGIGWEQPARSNEYLRKWYGFREYLSGKIHFLRLMRNVSSHKREHGLPDLFVEFLLYAYYPYFLTFMQNQLSDPGHLKKLRFEELLPSMKPSGLSSRGLDWDILSGQHLDEEDLSYLRQQTEQDINDALLARADKYLNKECGGGESNLCKPCVC